MKMQKESERVVHMEDNQWNGSGEAFAFSFTFSFAFSFTFSFTFTFTFSFTFSFTFLFTFSFAFLIHFHIHFQTYNDAVANAVAVLVHRAKATAVKGRGCKGAGRQNNVAQTLVDLGFKRRWVNEGGTDGTRTSLLSHARDAPTSSW